MSLKALKDKVFKITFVIKSVIFVCILFNGLGFVKQKVNAASGDTSYFQGKIVVKSDGTNISSNNPSCVITGSPDTCDFRVEYYSTDTGGDVLWQEDYNNLEIGNKDGLFSLALGTGSKTSGTETSYKNIFINNSDVYMQISFDKDGNDDFNSPEVFTLSTGKRMQIRSVPYAITAGHLASSNNQFIKNQSSLQTSSSFNIDGNGRIAGAFAVGTDNIFYVNGSTNKIGIGTTAPSGFFSVGASSQFQINSSGAITSSTGISSSGSIYFSDLTSGLLKTDGTGLISIATGGSDYENPLLFTGPLSRVINSISITQSSSITDGFLSSTDWNIFNNNPVHALLTGRTTGQTFTGSIDTNTGLTLRSTSANGTTGADIIFQTGNNGAKEAMRILNSGNIGIGINNPSSLLNLYGGSQTDTAIKIQSANTGSASEDGLYIGVTNSNKVAKVWNYENSDLIFGTDNIERLKIESDGSVFIKSIDTSGGGTNYALRIDSDGLLYRDSSSLRYKENILGLTDNFEAILGVEPKEYNFIGRSGKEIGFIAEDLDKIGLKNLVIYDNLGKPDSVKYDKIPMYLLEVVKQQQKQINGLLLSSIINTGGGSVTATNVQLNDLVANRITSNWINTKFITSIDLNVTGLLTSEKIITKLIQASKDENITMQLSEHQGLTGIEIQDDLGNRLFGVDSIGNIEIKGKISFINEPQNRSTGTDNVPKGLLSIQIMSNSINPESKVFINVKDNSETFPVLKVSKVELGLFEVKIDKIRKNDTVFDWFVMN